MNKKQQLGLIDFFDEVRKAEQAAEKIKAKFPAVAKELHIIFKRISRQNKYITPSLWRDYVSTKIQATENDYYLLFSRFDHNLEGEVSLEQFEKQLSPLSKSDSKKAASLEETEQRLAELLQCYIYHEDLLNVCRKNLKQIVPYQAFDQIAIEKKGFISKQQLKCFYQANEGKLKERNAELLNHGLKRRSYRNITLEAFSENLNPLEMGYYKAYQESIDEDQRIKYERKQIEDASEIRKKREAQGRIVKKQNRNQRVQQAQHDRRMYIEELRKLKQHAERERQERQSLQRTLEIEQKMRHELEEQIKLYKQQTTCNEIDRKLLDRLKGIKNQELAESRELDEGIERQEKYLQQLKRKVISDKRELMNRSDINNDRIKGLKVEKDYDELRDLQYQQQSLYARLLSPVTQKTSQHSLGKIYSPRAQQTPIHDLYKSSLGSTKGDFSTLYSSQPYLRNQYLYKY